MNKKLILFFIFIFAAFFLTLGDYFHHLQGVASYPSNTLPTIFGIPFWVPIQFGLAAVLGVSLIPLELKFNKTRTPPKHLGLLSIFFSFLFVMMPYIFSSFYFSNPVIKTTLIFMMGIIPWLINDGTSQGLISILVMSFVGVSYEATLGILNIFTYIHSPENIFFSVPIWLFGIYTAAGTTIRIIAYTYYDI